MDVSYQTVVPDRQSSRHEFWPIKGRGSLSQFSYHWLLSAFYSLTQESVPVVSSLLGNTADLSSNTLAQRLGMQYGSHVQIFI